jgi:hypothetical protein
MSYIGRGTESISNVEVLDNLTFNGSASYTLQKSSTNFVPSSANNLLISISGVVQQGNFSVSGSTITFDTTVSASDTCDWILHYGTGLITTVADGAITEAKLGSNAVTTAKINNGAITSAKLDSGLALGKIGQVVQAETTTMFTTSSATFVTVTGLSASITPSSASSKILVMLHYRYGANSSAVNGTRLLRGATEISLGDTLNNLSNVFASHGNTGSGFGNFIANYLDSPSTTSSTTYSVQVKSDANNLYVNSRNDGNANTNTLGSITLMEVLA